MRHLVIVHAAAAAALIVVATLPAPFDWLAGALGLLLGGLGGLVLCCCAGLSACWVCMALQCQQEAPEREGVEQRPGLRVARRPA
jgi:hypothetical protein